MELEAEEDEITCDYLSDMMAEIDVVIEKLKAVCWSRFLDLSGEIPTYVKKNKV